MPITWNNLGDFARMTGELPAGFVTGRTGALTPDARASAQASINAEALRQAASGWGSGGMALPATPPPRTFQVPQDAVTQSIPGMYPAGCCPDKLALASPFDVAATDLDVTPPSMRYFVGDTIPGATPVIQREQVSLSADPVNAVLIKSQSLPTSRLFGTPSPAAAFVPQQVRQAVQARQYGVSRSVAELERAALLPQNITHQGVPQQFAGLGATPEWTSDQKKAVAKLVADAELTWAQYTAGQRTLPANFKTNLEALRGVLIANNFESSWLPVAVGGWPSAADLRARIGKLQNLMIQRERPGAIGAGVTNRDGSPRVDSQARAAARSLEQDAAAAARAAAAAAEELRRRAAAATSALPWVIGGLAVLGVGAYAYGRGRR